MASSEPSSLAMFGSAANIFSAGMGVLSGIFGAAAQREDAAATARALTLEKNFNIGVLRKAKTDQMWADNMSLWRSGLSTSQDTSASGVIENNQMVLEENIKFQEQKYDINIGNANAAANRRFLGIF